MQASELHDYTSIKFPHIHKGFHIYSQPFLGNCPCEVPSTSIVSLLNSLSSTFTPAGITVSLALRSVACFSSTGSYVEKGAAPSLYDRSKPLCWQPRFRAVSNLVIRHHENIFTQ